MRNLKQYSLVIICLIPAEMPFIVPKPDLPMLLPWLKASLPASFKV